MVAALRAALEQEQASRSLSQADSRFLQAQLAERDEILAECVAPPTRRLASSLARRASRRRSCS